LQARRLGLPLYAGGIVRLRPHAELLQQRLLGLGSRAQALVETPGRTPPPVASAPRSRSASFRARLG
jgi:hypothetical protein